MLVQHRHAETQKSENGIIGFRAGHWLMVNVVRIKQADDVGNCSKLYDYVFCVHLNRQMDGLNAAKILRMG